MPPLMGWQPLQQLLTPEQAQASPAQKPLRQRSLELAGLPSSQAPFSLTGRQPSQQAPGAKQAQGGKHRPERQLSPVVAGLLSSHAVPSFIGAQPSQQLVSPGP